MHRCSHNPARSYGHGPLSVRCRNPVIDRAGGELPLYIATDTSLVIPDPGTLPPPLTKFWPRPALLTGFPKQASGRSLLWLMHFAI
jgi:hypothetical protein